MDDIIKSDLYRYEGKSDLKSFWKAYLRAPGFRFTFFLRKVQKHKKTSVQGIFYRILYRRCTIKYGFQIPKQVVIGKGLQIMHFGAIVVNSKTVIGSNCYLSHGITIGQTNRGKKQGVPVIGDKVYIGAGAVVVGGINIGNNVLIAPNAYVNFDVPPNSIVLGNPGKIIPNDNAVEGYLVNLSE